MATLYVDLMSQPSRACAIVCDLAGLTTTSSSSSSSSSNGGAGSAPPAVAVATLRLDRGEQRAEPFASLNPLQKVPFLALPPPTSRGDGAGQAHPLLKGIPESGAIIPYLAAAFPGRVPASFRRPAACPVAAARHDASLLWVQSSLRAGAMRVVFNRVIGPLVFKKSGSRDVAEHGAQVLKGALADLERTWLANGRRRFIGGGGGDDDDAAQAGTADLLCLCELDQLMLLDAADPDGGPCTRDFIPPGSVVEAWRGRVREACGGEAGAYGRATRTLRAAAARGEEARRRDGGAGSPL